MEYRIREIRPGDDAAVEGVIRACLREFGADHEGTAWADPDLCRFSQIYRGEDRRYWVAEDEAGQIVGGTGIGPLPGVDGVCELQKMYCLPSARGAGLGRRLMEQALSFARERYRRCYLETLENMTGAHALYERSGFHRIDRPLTDTGHFCCDVIYIKDL